MARYIDADALLSKLPDDLPYKASVKRVLMQAPESLTRVKYTPPTKDIEDFIVGYESPIQKYVNEIVNDMQDKEDAYTMECIRNIGIDVNKEELVKALQYDRDQYNKGFTAGFRVAKSEVAIEIIQDIAKACAPHDHHLNSLDFEIGYITAMNKVIAQLEEIKKKYTEEG